jgi:signal peptidase I
MQDFCLKLVSLTEKYLSWKKRRKLIHKEKQKKKGLVQDWGEAFIWAAGVVLLINQFFFQAYQIPSGSMEDTLLVGDRLFVNKFIYGPELIPGQLKTYTPYKPHRGDVIIFENPTYIGQGPVMDIIQRVVYMISFSLIDLDRDQLGKPKVHFLIKRAAAEGKDHIRLTDGELEFRISGKDGWTEEAKIKSLNTGKFKTKRLIDSSIYPDLKTAAEGSALRRTGLPPGQAHQAAGLKIEKTGNVDAYTFTAWYNRTLYMINPADSRTASEWFRYDNGFYVPANHVMTLGDNRDNSRDGRYYGPVKLKKVLGKAMFKYFPFNRAGGIY